jgi:hypothetical protein
MRGWSSLSPTEKSNFFIALFSGLLALVTIFQAWAFVQSQRAFLSVAALKFLDGLAPNQKVSPVFGIRNGGRSTAVMDELNVTFKTVTPPNVFPLTPQYFEGTEIAPGPIVADGTVNVTVDMKGFTIDEATFRPISAGERVVYVYGFISYWDDYSLLCNRITGFCFRYDYARSIFSHCLERAYTYVRYSCPRNSRK